MLRFARHFTAWLFVLVLFTAGCTTLPRPKERITRFFNWNAPGNELQARRYAEAGVTDVLVRNKRQYELAQKYGMTPYWKCFTPAGPHYQVMTPEEEKHYAFIAGLDLDPKLPKAERTKILHQRRKEIQHRYGGEMVTAIDTLSSKIFCFISDENLQFSKEKLDKLLKDAPKGVAGMNIDFAGYMNHNGCYCKSCLEKYRKYLAVNKLADTPENKTRFYREKLVEYCNSVIDCIKSKRPHYKIVIHIYPDFKADPLYGNRIKADFCGQTVAWYFKWDTEKIKRYTRFTVEKARDYHAFAQGIPFLGLSTDPESSLGYKTPADVEREIKAILSAGGETLMICCGHTVIEDGYFEVFKKYCGKK